MLTVNHLKAGALVGAMAMSTLLPGLWTLYSTPVAGLDWRIGTGETQRAYESRFEENFPFTNAVAQGWSALKLRYFNEPAQGAILGHGGILFTAEEFTAPAQQTDIETALTEAKTKIEATGGLLLPVIVPDKARMRSDALPRLRSPRFDARYDRLLDTISATGLRAVDLRPALSGKDSFLITDTHWSPQGASRVAALISKSLPDILPGTDAFITRPTGMRPFSGDLTAFADTGRWKSVAGPVSEQIKTFETSKEAGDASTGLALFADVAVPLALVGTSYSAKPLLHFEGFLKSELQTDLVNHAEVGKGPFEPMKEFLDQLEHAQNPPAVVIWEIPERYVTP